MVQPCTLSVFVYMYGSTTVAQNICIAWLYGDSVKYSIVHSCIPVYSDLANCKFTLVQSSKINQPHAGTKTSS